MLTQAELGWLAGIFEGEGSASIRRNGGSRKNMHGRQPFAAQVIAVVNTDLIVIQRVCDLLHKLEIHWKMCEQNAKYNPRWTPCFRVYPHHMLDQAKFLSIMEPYLVGVKKQQAMATRMFIETHITRKHAGLSYWKKGGTDLQKTYDEDARLWESQPSSRKREFRLQ